MIIDFCTIHDPAQIGSWSGLNHFISRTIASFASQVNYITNFQPRHTTQLKLRFRISKSLGKNFYYDLTSDYCRQYAEQLEQKLSSTDSIIFTTNSQLVAHYNGRNKVVIYNDATFGSLDGYYTYFSNLTPYDQREIYRNERRAFDRADLLLFASEWAASSAVQVFGADPGKIHVIPFGANLLQPPTTEEVEKMQAVRCRDKQCSLLFVGVDFERKGGEQAIAITSRLRKKGIPATLLMLGMHDLAARMLPEFVQDGGFLDKSIPGQLQQLEKHFSEADFYVMPSQQECYGLVFCEAFAYGLPVMGFNTGGVSSIISPGYNGWLCELGTSAEVMAQLIEDCYRQPGQYQLLSRQARQSFEQTYNWEVVGKRIADLLKSL